MVEPQDNTQLLDETALKAELATLVSHNKLSPRIAQKLGDKIHDKHLTLTKTQLLRLVKRLQSILQALPAPQQTSQPTQTTTAIPDMKRLYDEVNNLKDRLQAIELTNHPRPPQQHHTPHTTDAIQTLETIPNDPTSIIIVMKWLNFMVERIGKTSLPDVLGYYVDIGWISDDVRLDLIDYAKGITDDTADTGTSNLPTNDHLQSLLYIQKLKGVDLDDRFLVKIDREIEKMTKSLQNYTANTPHHDE